MFSEAGSIIQAAIADRAFPAATIEIGRSTGPLWTQAWGRLGYTPDAMACTPETVFDLASLTKVIAVASLVMDAISHERLALDMKVASLIQTWTGPDRAGVTIRHLLEHASGLPAHVRLFEHASGRAQFERAIVESPLEYPPGTRSLYSDLGFMLLGFILADVNQAPLDAQFQAVRASWPGCESLTYRPSPGERVRIAPTEQDSWRGRLLQGEVHDENAAALGGVAGHAGLFGDVRSVGAFATLLLVTFHQRTSLGEPRLLRRFATKSTVPDSSRALAWDTMKPTSSCGTLMSPTSIGHTGFTGTSLWIDHERDLYVALLTNRVHPTRENDAMIALRPQVHDAIVRAFDREFATGR